MVADLCAFYRDRQRAVMGLDGAPMHDSCRRSLVPGADLGRIEPRRPANARLAVDANRRAIIDLVLDTVLTYA